MTSVTPGPEQLAELWFCLLVLKQLTELEMHHISLRHNTKPNRIKPSENVPLRSDVKWGESECDLKESVFK